MMTAFLRRLAVASGGNIAIEFALALPILSLLLLGLADLGRYSMQKSALLQGAQEGANYGVQYPADTSGMTTTAQNATGLTGVTATPSVFCECTSGTQVNCSSTCSTKKKYVAVTTTKAFTSVLPTSTTSFANLKRWSLPTTITATVTMICASSNC